MSSSRFLWFTLYVYSFLVLSVSVMPVSGPQIVTNQDKVIHFFMYATMAGLAVLARKYSKHKAVLLASFLHAVAFGLTMEVIQYFLPYRSFEIGDILANSTGALFAVILARSLRYA